MIEVIQTFISYTGITLFIVGLFFCFIATTFRYGVFCTLIGNLLFCVAIIFPKQVVEFLEIYKLSELFYNVDIEIIKEKAIITGFILLGGMWGLRWLKHVITKGTIIFLFPRIATSK